MCDATEFHLTLGTAIAFGSSVSRQTQYSGISYTTSIRKGTEMIKIVIEFVAITIILMTLILQNS